MAQELLDQGKPPAIASAFKLFHQFEQDYSQYPSAGFQVRALATILDGIIYAVANEAIGFLLEGTYEYLRVTSPGAYFALTMMITVILVGYYYAWPVNEWGATPGKKLLGLKIVSNREDGKVSFWQAFNRCTFGYALSLFLFCFGFLRVIWRKDKLALHDDLFHTRVILCKK